MFKHLKKNRHNMVLDTTGNVKQDSLSHRLMPYEPCKKIVSFLLIVGWSCIHLANQTSQLHKVFYLYKI